MHTAQGSAAAETQLCSCIDSCMCIVQGQGQGAEAQRRPARGASPGLVPRGQPWKDLSDILCCLCNESETVTVRQSLLQDHTQMRSQTSVHLVTVMCKHLPFSPCSQLQGLWSRHTNNFDVTASKLFVRRHSQLQETDQNLRGLTHKRTCDSKHRAMCRTRTTPQ